MARVPITEHRAKLLILGGIEEYAGVSVSAHDIENTIKKLSEKNAYVVKVDQGVKGRFKKGLLALDVKRGDITGFIKNANKAGYTRFIIEPFFPHEAASELYLSLERVREGVRILYSAKGGVDIEEAKRGVKSSVYTGKNSELRKPASSLGVTQKFLKHLILRMDETHMSFLEINPLITAGGKPVLIDTAVQVDDTAEFFVRGAWTMEDVPGTRRMAPEETAVEELNRNSPAQFSLRVLNRDGRIAMLLSSGGASIAIADEAYGKGASEYIINYGEYSGGPTTEETYLYAKQVLSLLLKSKAKKKALVVAGGVANFTDILETFTGVILAMDEKRKELKGQKIKVFVRRGGPNEKEGLRAMEAFLKKNGLFGSIAGSEALLSDAVGKAIRFVKS